MDLTLEQLATYNGLNGAKAYVVVNGKIYDVTSSSTWSIGTHHTSHHPGNDLSDAFASKHNDSRMNSFPIIGNLVTGGGCITPTVSLNVGVF